MFEKGDIIFWKAGGPEYLKRLCYEQSISNNTAAMGGNASLLAEVDD